MVLLKRITTQYCENEDRIRLTGENADGSLMCLWLSHRFLNRLIPFLLDWLEKTSTSDVKASPPQSIPIQNFEQHEALAQLNSENSTKSKKPTPSFKEIEANQWLVNEVDIKRSNHILHLVFKNQKGKSAELLLKTIELRQWLFIICSQWEKSEWSREIWSEWITCSEVIEISNWH